MTPTIKPFHKHQENRIGVMGTLAVMLRDQ